MFGLNNRSSFSASSSTTFSPPSAVVVSGDDGCSSSSNSSEDGLGSYGDHGDHDDHKDDGGVSYDDSYGVSNDVSKQGKKSYQPRRSLLDQLRLCFLTGRLSRLLVQAITVLAVGITSYRVFSKMMQFLLSPHDEPPLPAAAIHLSLIIPKKPIMMAMYFTDVSSLSFTGRVHHLTPPRTNDEWMQMLEKRLQNHHPHQERRHKYHHLDSRGRSMIAVVEPLSKGLDSIEEDSEFYEDEKPELTPNPEQCTPQYDWQTASYPACNSIHENTMMWDRMFLRPYQHSSRRTNAVSRKLLKQQVKQPDELHHNNMKHQHHHDHDHDHRDRGNHATTSGHHRQRDNMRRRLLTKKIKEDTRVKKTRRTIKDDNNTKKKTTGRTPEEDIIAATPQKQEVLQQQYRVLAHGYWRDTWMMKTPLNNNQGHEMIAFKTMKLEHELTEYLMDKQRRDAVTSDRLTFSKQTIAMYGMCGTSALYEYAPGGDLKDLIGGFDSARDFTRYYSSQERLILAYNVTCALSDLHTTEGPRNPPAIVHGDFKTDQFVAVTPVVKEEQQGRGKHRRQAHHNKLPHFKLGDFNLARFVYWNEKHQHPCVIKPDGNGGKNRAPEEYAKEKGRTEKLDIYSLGNVLYTILTGHFPFDDLKNAHGTKEMKILVQQGRRPHVNIDADIRHSKDPLERAMLQAVEMCWKHDPHDRASARQVEAVLQQYVPKEFVRNHRRAKKDTTIVDHENDFIGRRQLK